VDILHIVQTPGDLYGGGELTATAMRHAIINFCNYWKGRKFQINVDLTKNISSYSSTPLFKMLFASRDRLIEDDDIRIAQNLIDAYIANAEDGSIGKELLKPLEEEILDLSGKIGFKGMNPIQKAKIAMDENMKATDKFLSLQEEHIKQAQELIKQAQELRKPQQAQQAPSSTQVQPAPSRTQAQQAPSRTQAQQAPSSAQAQQAPSSAQAQQAPSSAQAQQAPSRTKEQQAPSSAQAPVTANKTTSKQPYDLGDFMRGFDSSSSKTQTPSSTQAQQAQPAPSRAQAQQAQQAQPAPSRAQAQPVPSKAQAQPAPSSELPIGLKDKYDLSKDIRHGLQKGVQINEDIIIGIKNFGSTCFANSTLQVFMTILRNLDSKQYCSEKGTCYLCKMIELYNQYIMNNIQDQTLRNLIEPIYASCPRKEDRKWNTQLSSEEAENAIIEKLKESAHGRAFVTMNFECSMEGDLQPRMIEVFIYGIKNTIQEEINVWTYETNFNKNFITYPLYFSAVMVNKLSKVEIQNEVYLKDKNQKYSLFAVIVHSDDQAGGHYRTFIKYRDNWFFADDNKFVTRTDFNTATTLMRNSYEGVSRLFYRKNA